MYSRRALLLSVLVALALVAVPLSGGGVVAGPDAPPQPTDVDVSQPALESPVATDLQAAADRDDDPSTEDTVGYAEGYWYDDELAVDDEDGAHVSEDELDEVVYRSMARTEEIRGLTFQEVPDVEVITREEFQAESEELFADLSERDALVENVRYEAFLMVERDSDAVESFEALYGGAVAGYYDPEADQVVLVSDDEDEVEVDEVTLGHELLHALQDQHFGLQGYDRETMDRDGAINGLIEGDAVFVDEQYADRCATEWDCLEPQASQQDMPDIVWGQYFSLIMPYDEGPDYVESVYEAGGWDAVDDLYDDPPASSSEVIRPDEDREPVDVGFEDRSDDAWSVLEPDEGPTVQRVGEVGIVSMFIHDSIERGGMSVLGFEDWFEEPEGGGETYHYDQPITDGWAGDALVVYATDDETVEETGYVWKTEWTSEDDAGEFLDAYLQLLGLHGAEPVDDRQNTLVVESDFPGAYHVEHDGESVRIVRAPSPDDLPSIHEEAGPEGEDTIDHDVFGTAESGDDAADDVADGDDDTIPGFGPIAALIAVLLAAHLTRRN